MQVAAVLEAFVATSVGFRSESGRCLAHPAGGRPGNFGIEEYGWLQTARMCLGADHALMTVSKIPADCMMKERSQILKKLRSDLSQFPLPAWLDAALAAMDEHSTRQAAEEGSEPEGEDEEEEEDGEGDGCEKAAPHDGDGIEN